MKILGIEFWKKQQDGKQAAVNIRDAPSTIHPQASVYGPNIGNNIPAQGYVYAVYDGEKNIGEMGPIKRYDKDFYALRMRSKQLYLESEICQVVINRFTQWVIGNGLKLKSEPQKEVLSFYKINIDTEAFNKPMESVWKVYANSKLPDYSGQQNLPALSEEAHREAKLGGDILVVLRVIDNLVRVQHIDGMHVGNPPGCSMSFVEDKVLGAQSANGYDFIYPETGNRIRLGVEIDATGAHVAYHVHVGVGLDYKRVLAKDSKGFTRAYMYYGFKPEIDATRGTPLLSVVMESAKKLERYNSAILAGAEETAKIAYVFEHGVSSNNEDPTLGIRLKASIGQPAPGGASATDLAVDTVGNALARDFAVSTEKRVINLPTDVKVTTLEGKQQVHVSEFSMFHVDMICASVNIPPNVAMSKYEDSFSASRMAGKDWEHTFMTERSDFSQHYLSPIHTLQMYVWILENRIQAPGFLISLQNKNVLAIEAYVYARWTGDMFPDIDPLKTVKFLREATGIASEQAPYMTLEAAAEYLGQGDYSAIIKQYGKELKDVDAAGIKLPSEDVVPPDRGTDEKEGQTKRKQRKPKG